MMEQAPVNYRASGSIVVQKDSGEVAQENLALRKLVTVYRHLSSLAVQDAGIEAVTELIAEHMDATVAVVDEKLTVLAAASPAGSAGTAAGDIQDRVGHPRLAQVLGVTGRTRRALRIPDVDQATPVVIAPVLVGDEVPAYLMALDGTEQETNDDLRLLLTEHAATICGVILGRERVVAAAATQVRYDLLEGLLSGRGSEVDEVLRWARHLGYDTDRDHQVISAVVEDDDAAAEPEELNTRVLAAIERFFTTHAPDAITALRDDEVVVVLPETDVDLPDSARSRAIRLSESCLKRTRELFRGSVATVGIGSVCRSPLDIARSYDDARRTVDVARRMGRGGVVLAFDDLGIHRLLMQVADPAQLRQFARDVFGALMAQPRGSAAEYLTTLGCYFRANNSPQRASKILHVHPNTVTYRIRRVEEITTLDFGNYRDRLMAQVALEILDAVGEGS